MEISQNRIGKDPQMVNQPASPIQGSSTGESVSAQSTTSRATIPKHTISHDEAALVQASSGPSILTENDCPEALAYAWPEWKKWGTLTIIFLVQISSTLLFMFMPLYSLYFPCFEFLYRYLIETRILILAL